MTNEILVAHEVAELLRVDKQRVYELVRKRQIPVIKLGERQYRFGKNEILEWLKNGGGNAGSNREGSEITDGLTEVGA